MSLDKAIQHGKEKRRPYRGSKAIDTSCRNHRGCPHCEASRLRRQQEAEALENAARVHPAGEDAP